MNAVISIVKGGLGNQLFIYAAGRAFALRNDRELYLDCERGFLHDNYGRALRLNHFPIEAQIMPEAWRIAPHLKHPVHKWIRAWNKLLPRDYRTYLAQNWNRPPDQLTVRTPKRKRVTLHGYWQDEAFFSDHADLIRRELSPPAPEDPLNLNLGMMMETERSVFLHARRFRYPTLLPVSYYHEALRGIREKVKDPVLFVFSDDSEWVRRNLKFDDLEVHWVEHNAEHEIADLWLMSRCHHAIIANSSFSWWGAWLGGPPCSGNRWIYTPDNPTWAMRPASGWIPIRCDV